MAKSPPGVRAEGAEAEPAGQPLVAKLKQDRLDSLAAVDAQVVQVIAEFTDGISEAIIARNRAMHTGHSEHLVVPVNAIFKGVDIDYHRFLTGVEQWAENNGIKLTISEQRKGITCEKYWIHKVLRLSRNERAVADGDQARKVFMIRFSWETE